jgi:hypothetical protein
MVDWENKIGKQSNRLSSLLSDYLTNQPVTYFTKLNQTSQQFDRFTNSREIHRDLGTEGEGVCYYRWVYSHNA